MYKVKNVVLGEILKPYKVNSLDDMSDDDLLGLCRDNKNLNVHAIFTKKEKKNGVVMMGGFDRYATIKKIEDTHTYSMYMGHEYWDNRHYNVIKNRRVEATMQDAEEGKDVMEVWDDIDFGFYRLKPGRSKELDVSKRWVEDFFNRQPAVKLGFITIEDIKEEDEEKEEKVVEPVKQEVKTEKIPTAWNEILKMAASYGISTAGISKPDLINKIKEKLNNEKDSLGR